MILTIHDLIDTETLSKFRSTLLSSIQEDLSKDFDKISKRVSNLYKADIDSMWYTHVDVHPKRNNVSVLAKTTKTTKQTTLKEVVKKTKKYQVAPVLKNIQQNIQTIYIRRNKYGNYEHEPTGLVFDKDEKVVYGVQRGVDVLDLSEAELELCKKYKFTPRIPENLDKYKENKIQKIDEYDLEDDDELIEDDDELVDDEEENEDDDFDAYMEE
jgi:hypothetical protein